MYSHGNPKLSQQHNYTSRQPLLSNKTNTHLQHRKCTIDVDGDTSTVRDQIIPSATGQSDFGLAVKIMGAIGLNCRLGFIYR